MKVLFNCHVPFMLAHGGAQVQIEQTKAALEQIGVETDYLQWWNDRQTGDILHHFGALPEETIRQAHDKGWKAVNTILLSENCNRPRRALLWRRILIRTAMAAPLPQLLRPRFHAFRMCDRVLVALEAEKQILVRSYGVQERSVRLVPLGLKEPFLKAGPGPRTGDYLISHGTIAPVKKSVELARLASVRARQGNEGGAGRAAYGARRSIPVATRVGEDGPSSNGRPAAPPPDRRIQLGFLPAVGRLRGFD
jgi:hypothetical protein